MQLRIRSIAVSVSPWLQSHILAGIQSDPPARSSQFRGLAGPTSARMIPRIAFTSRDDQPVLVKIVRIVFRVAWVRDGGWK